MGDRMAPPRWLKYANKLVMVLRQFPAQVPVGVDLMTRAGVLETGTPDELEGMAGRLPVFRVDPIT
ncbi:hypothetical protein [Mycobacterium neumannii]|uniref:hypothetical protein n=1 Tax=Mycobacterium neumannii TaxID=2048551 RepID=UPI003AB8C078